MNSTIIYNTRELKNELKYQDEERQSQTTQEMAQLRRPSVIFEDIVVDSHIIESENEEKKNVVNYKLFKKTKGYAKVVETVIYE